ncbi:MAG TPA: hypothetical protein VMD30_07130, partial [Tepidisphaeraceae bacterium]|nr:hypothetical protein [Tepidisphaeraceae bacterium]
LGREAMRRAAAWRQSCAICSDGRPRGTSRQATSAGFCVSSFPWLLLSLSPWTGGGYHPCMRSINRHALIRWLFVPIVLLTQLVALADDDNGPPIDARWRGFPGDSANLNGQPPKVWLPGGGVAGTWIIFIILGVLCIGFLFMNAKRTHLD